MAAVPTLILAGLGLLVLFVVVQVRVDARRRDWSQPVRGPGWRGWLVLAASVGCCLAASVLATVHVAGLFSA